MSSRWRRFEEFNDGRDVPPESLAEAVLEIVAHFGAASYETQKVEGHWRHGGVLYRDNLVARAAAAVNHPNVCQLYEIGEHEGALYIAMELLEGEPLSERLIPH